MIAFDTDLLFAAVEPSHADHPLAGDAYRVVVAEEPEAGRLRSVRFPELAIDLDPLWDEIDRALTGRLPG